MKSKEKMLHYAAAKYILGENFSIRINGEESQLAVLCDLLKVSKELKESLDSKNIDIEKITKLVHEKKELTKEFQSLTDIIWRL